MSKEKKGTHNQPDRSNRLTRAIVPFQMNPYPLVGQVLFFEELLDAVDYFQVSHGIFPALGTRAGGVQEIPEGLFPVPQGNLFHSGESGNLIDGEFEVGLEEHFHGCISP
jgi:hypothetical protein